MKQLINAIKYIFYRLVSKKMLITVILGLLLFILLNDKVFAVDGEYLTDRFYWYYYGSCSRYVSRFRVSI